MTRKRMAETRLAKPSALAQAGLLARLAGRGLKRRLNGGTDPQKEAAAFTDAFTAAMAKAEPGLAAWALCEALGEAADWVDTGIDLKPGQPFSLFAAGAVWLAKPLDLRFGPQTGLWFRVGEGPVRKMLGATHTGIAEEGGRLTLITKPPGEWLTEDGRFDPAYPREKLEGAFCVGIAIWKNGHTRQHLASLTSLHPLFEREWKRLEAPIETPEGWHYLWRLGEGEIYRQEMNADNCMHCHTKEDVGILQYPVEMPLTDALTLDWCWKADRLPSSLAENIQPTHDYLSIAVEFDNGQDLTYMWSAKLKPGTIFRCPLPWWDQRETHWVVRGPEDLGRWLDEARPLKADYETAIGGPLPKKIVAVWLIAVSCFQRGEGVCAYDRIDLVDGRERVRVV
ncbi:DUF3047 domain-containing protein [Tepidicaulis sp. LMO-SS28]|uniref:DUF3047 domain-containing protein n=1 Tax=Tepidicaulis sp. LMO-SS28 TaxID=3447455 RepID=UPI003EE40D61